MRNVSLKEVMINGQKYTYTEDLIGQDLHTVMRGSIDQVNRILDAAHSGKQHFRDQVAVWRDHPFDDERKGNNDRAAVNTTNTIYVPVALALSDRFADKV